MYRGISCEMFQDIIANHWEQISCFAFDEFRQQGRGVVEIQESESGDPCEMPEFRLLYFVHDLDSGKLQPDIAEMIRAYDPKWEVVIRYTLQEGGNRTTRLRTPEGERHPWLIWFFEYLPLPEQEFELDTRGEQAS